jgi:hypothetical protein
MAKKAASTNEVTYPVQLTNSELVVHFKTLEERNKIAEQKKNEEQKRLEEQPKLERHKRLLLIFRVVSIVGLFIILGYFFYLFYKYVLPKNMGVVSGVPSNLTLSYVAPKYLAVGDDNAVEITLKNLDTRETFNGTVILIISDLNNSVTSTLDRRMSIPIKDLLPNDRLTSQFKLKLSKDPCVESINFHFQITLPNGTSLYESSEGVFLVSRIQGVRSVWIWLVSSGGLGAILSYWDQIKKLLKKNNLT